MKPTFNQTCRMVLEIAGPDGKRTAYTVRPIASQIPEHRRSYQVKKLATGDVYHITQEASGLRNCDCAAHTFRDGSCKHTRALAALGLFLSPKELAALNVREQRK